MRRPVLALFTSLAVALLVFGVLADRALVREAASAEELAATRREGEQRSVALSVRGALGLVEQEVLLDQSPPASAGRAMFRLPPSARASLAREGYRARRRAELSTLLLSTESTREGLPEAVVAAVALGAPAEHREVRERLLSGQLPVHPEDLPELARIMGAEDDPRIANLQNHLQTIPKDLPEAPAFRRRLMPGSIVQGWTRKGSMVIEYTLAVKTLLASAGVADRAELGRTAAVEPSKAMMGVPDVDGLSLRVRSSMPSPRHLLPARALLWTAVASCLVALIFVQRALARQARAVARERSFIASVTHELRTPVAAMRVLGETLADGTGDSKVYGSLVATESERLESLVERVLAAARVEEAPRFSSVNPAELLRSTSQLMQARAGRRGVHLEVRESDALGSAQWDAESVRRALLNLIDNAIKHGRANGHVEVFGEGRDGEVRLSVRDDGAGIGHRSREKLFGRFERGTTDAPGTGLGLYLVDQAARAHGGRVDLSSAEGRGSTFTLVLPRVPPGSVPAEGPDA
jgi:signal transduction histidine kinase